MFENSLLESGGAEYSKLYPSGPWAPLASFAIEAGMLGLLLLLPLIYTQTLPQLPLNSYLTAPVPPPPRAPIQVIVVHESSGPADAGGRLLTPTRIPPRIVMTPGEPEAALVPSGIPGGTGTPGVRDGFIGSGLLPVLSPAVPVARVATPPRIKVSDGITAGLLVRKVQPIYPPLARQARISGEVVLQAVIGKDGSIRNLQTISGHPMLIQSAIDAVRQWRYKPYLLNGDPVEVDTQIHVNFTLTGS